jgi:hypothetical protein
VMKKMSIFEKEVGHTPIPEGAQGLLAYFE